MIHIVHCVVNFVFSLANYSKHIEKHVINMYTFLHNVYFDQIVY